MRLLAVMALVVAIPACAPRRVLTPAPVVDASLPAADHLLRSVSQRRERIHSLRSEARLAYSSPTEKRRAKQVILASRPDRLRFEVLSPFGAVFVLATSAGRLAAYARDEAKVYRGTASPENLERYTSVQLPVVSAVDLLLGTPPISDARAPVVSRDEGKLRLLCDERDGSARVVWFTADMDPDRFEEWTKDGDVTLRATFSRYTDVNGVRLPLQLSLEAPAAQRRVDIELRDPEVNPDLTDPLFALDTPRGATDVDLDQELN